jgi:predicted lipoprotein
LQGLSAHERLLYDDGDEIARFGSEQQPAYSCQLLTAIAHNLDRMAADILREWTADKPSYREIVLGAVQGNRYFESSEEFSARMLNNLYTSLQVIVDQKLMLPLGVGPAEANPRRAESWRSRRSLRNIVLNLEAAEELYITGYSGVLKVNAQAASLDKEIQLAFTRALQAAQAVRQPMDDAQTLSEQRPALEHLLAAASELERLLSGPLPSGLGLSLGFNSLDGD